MLKNLVIVESPAKAKTIEKFLGKDYKVMSSYGHIRDLRKKGFGIDKEADFTPIYEIPEDKSELVENLKKAASEAKMIWLASDEDREGEAIAWHLYEVLGLKPENTRRIVFHEITKDAILHAIENPRSIDLNRVNAQQARRVLDRLVGFELSPVLWKKIKPSLSAGRVQSVAVRLIVERENEIKNFVPESYMRISGIFATHEGTPIKADLAHRVNDKETAKGFLDLCNNSTFRVVSVNKKPLIKSPAPPFTTSTLQQEASRKLGFTVSQTMMVAQRLYEAGHITYMRTDSLNLSSLAIKAISAEIKEKLGEEYLKIRHYQTHSKGAQEAHEAIRPTYIDKTDIEGTTQEKRLYQLIRRRTIACQMADAQIEKTTIDILPFPEDSFKNSSTSDNIQKIEKPFIATGEVVKFNGFLQVYIEGHDEIQEENNEVAMLPAVKEGEILEMKSITATERYTQHPPRYTEASLVKKMEELGIGRPSTYAPTISTVQQREYVEKGDRPGVERKILVLSLSNGELKSAERKEIVGAEKGKLLPTDTGTIVNDFLTDFFPNILDYNFTANVEEQFDEIAEGNTRWNDEIRKFYSVFHPEVERAENIRFERKVGERVLGKDPSTGRTVSVKIGRFGPVVQIGESTDEEKPQFASLRKNQSVFDISIEEALKLFELPRELGNFEGKDVIVGVGRFGPYVKHAGKFVSIPKDISPFEITLEEAVVLIENKRLSDANKIVKIFEEDPTLQILNGRFGVYISFNKSNYKIPKNITNPAELSYEDCKSIIEQQETKPKKATRKSSSKTAK